MGHDPKVEFSMDVSRRAERAWIGPIGKLDIDAIPRLKLAINVLVKEGNTNIQLDLRRVNFVSPEATSFMVQTDLRLSTLGGHLTVINAVNAADQLREIRKPERTFHDSAGAMRGDL